MYGEELQRSLRHFLRLATLARHFFALRISMPEKA